VIPPSTPLRGLPYAAIDFEATGFAGPDAHVVEVAVVHGVFGDATPPRVVYTARVRPPVAIPEAATAVHGITDADVADAPTFAEIWPALREAIRGCILVAYNAPADRTFLATELERLGLECPEPWLCLLVVRKTTKTRGRPGKLGEVAAEYGIVLDAHGAAGDALTAGLLVRPLLRRAVEFGVLHGAEYGKPPQTLGELLDWQRRQALAQEQDWAAYCRRQGNATPPRSPWHELFGVPSPTWEAPVRTTGCPSCGVAVQMRIGQAGAVVYVSPGSNEAHVCAEAGAR